jgi:hypothetical protein
MKMKIRDLFIAAILCATPFSAAQSEEFNAGYEFCSNPYHLAGHPTTEENPEYCIASCKKMADVIQNSGNLEAAFLQNGYGQCTGSASDIQRTIYKIELAQDAADIRADDVTRCTIWEGEMAVSFRGMSAGDVIKANSPIDTSSCAAGTYDTMLITQSRFIKYSGTSVFPHDASKPVRTFSSGVTGVQDIIAGTADPSVMIEAAIVQDGLAGGSLGAPSADANMAAADKPVVRLFDEGVNTDNEDDMFTVIRKFTTDYATPDEIPAAEQYMDFDELYFFTGGDDAERPGYYCEMASMCARALPDDYTKMEWLLQTINDPGEDLAFGLPVEISADTTVNIEFGYFAPVDDGLKEIGLWYAFLLDRSVSPPITRAVGAQPGEDGLYILVSVEQESDTSH